MQSAHHCYLSGETARQLQRMAWERLFQLRRCLSEALAARQSSRLGRAGDGHWIRTGDFCTDYVSALSDVDQAQLLDLVRIETGRRISGSPALEHSLKSLAVHHAVLSIELFAMDC